MSVVRHDALDDCGEDQRSITGVANLDIYGDAHLYDLDIRTIKIDMRSRRHAVGKVEEGEDAVIADFQVLYVKVRREVRSDFKPLAPKRPLAWLSSATGDQPLLAWRNLHAEAIKHDLICFGFEDHSL